VPDRTQGGCNDLNLRDNEDNALQAKLRTPLRLKGKHLLQAKLVGLRVLAPAAFYSGSDLRMLENELVDGLRYFCEGFGWQMDFRFHVFPRWFTPQLMRHDDLESDNVSRALRDRYPLIID